MAIFTTSAGIFAIAGTSVLLLRRRISRNWIDLRKKKYDHLSGKTIVITGGNVGLGFEGAKEFARRDANVVIACRNTTKGEEAVASISKATGNEHVSCVKLDLASLESVKSFISEVQSKYTTIDLLVLNAGVWVPMENGMKTQDGYEIHFGVNHLSHLLIAKSLVPQMEKSSLEGGGRLIFVSSALMKQGRTDDLKTATYEGRVEKDENGKPKKSFSPTGYCDSKLMNALTCKHMATILPGNVSTYSVCPGFCRSSLGRNVTMPLHQKIVAAPIMLMIQRTQSQGAQNIVFAAAESNLVSGSLYRDGEIMEKEMQHMENVGGDTEAKKLWDWSEELLKE
mmetsp:Transcript_21635/g.27304  ORF Transcript_21635/g.27304 Transcript_21635/m.27304 type:complete len:339 (+) Transcript_21635:46-1062(+)